MANDLISRQAAIDAFCEMCRSNYPNTTACDICDDIEILKKLPSAQPEQVRTQMSSADCISRQAAIDALNIPDYENREAYMQYEEDVNAIHNLPSAQSEKICIANVTLSEETLKELVEKAKAEIAQSMLTVIEPDDAQPTIESERKKGKWVEPTQEGCFRHDAKAYAECSECGKKEFLGWRKNFCPNCGTKMEVEE